MTSGVVLFPQNLAKILALKGFSGVAFSEMTFVSQGNTAHWLKGRSLPNKNVWDTIETVLECPMWMLFHPKGAELYLKLHPELAAQ